MQEKDWFKDWFNSPYYHILYKHRDYKEAEIFIDNLVNFLKPNLNSRMLDLACGKGRHSIYLNKLGFDVTGVDLSKESISDASKFENARLSFFVHDMRNVLRVNYFDYIFNLFTSFGYFKKERDNYSAIESAVKALKSNGTIVIDFLNIIKTIAELNQEEIKNIDGIEFHIKRSIESGFIVKDIYFSDKGNEFHFQEKVKTISLDDFKDYFKRSGLQLIHLFGDYQLNIFDPEKSDRLILVGKKEK